MKKLLAAGSIIGILILVIAFYFIQSNQTTSTQNEPIRIGISLWAGDAHAFLAQEKGFFKKNNVNVELVYDLDYPISQKKYNEGDADGLFATLSDAIYYNAIGKKSAVVYVTDFSDSADVIVGYDNSLSDLKGKTISVESMNSYSHIFVLKSLEKVGLTEKDLNFKVVPAHEVLNALETGKIDAGHTWEPTTSETLAKGYNILFTGGQVPGIITSTLIFDKSIIEQRPNDVQAIVKSMVEAQEYRDSNWSESIDIMATAYGISYDEMEAGFMGLQTLSLEQNIDAFSKSSNRSLFVSGDYIVNYYLERGQIIQPYDLDGILDSRFVKNLNRQ